MKTVIFATFLMVSLFVGLPSTLADQKPPIEVKKPSISDLITLNAQRYHVSEKTIRSVISCESQYNPSAIGDFGHSYGLVQIHLPSHSNITKAQALNPEFAIEYLAKNLSLGNGSMWTCWRMLG